MTTENQPAESSAATDQTGQVSSTEDQPSAADPKPLDEAELSPRQEAAPVKTVSDPRPAEPTLVDAPPSQASAEPAPTTGEVSAAETSVSQPIQPRPIQPPRRVRLNPTVAPEVARPIPTLRPSDPPSPAAQPVATTSSQKADGRASAEPSDSAAAADTMADAALQESDESEAAMSVTSPSVTSPSDAESSVMEPSDPPLPPAEPVALPGKNESLDADLEAELEAAMAGSDQPDAPVAVSAETAEIADQAAQVPLTPDADVKRGTKLTGTVASIHGDDMFLDFGLRVPGVLSRRQFGLRKQPMQGETLEVVVGRIDEKEGLMHVNLPTGTSRVRGEWDALHVDQNVECMVTGTNKGGLEVSIGALRGFMPASQVELGFVPDLNVYIGQKLKARIAEVNPKRRKLVLSRRALLEEEREHSQQELFEKIEPGQQYTGRVRTLKDYGAFVDIGGADGLLHVAQISWSRINHPSEVLQEGEEIQVQVLSVDKDKKKISLGMRQLTQNPWKSAESKYAQGAQVKGKVTRIENFGAFVELDEGVEGLVHISELDHKRVNKVSEVLRVGQEVEIQVLEVDPKRKRVSLSLKALKEKPDEPSEKTSSEPIKRQRSVDSLVGGIGKPTGGQLFGDPNKFSG